MKDRGKRNTSSRYASIAMAVDDEPKSYQQALSCPDSVKWQEAIDAELAALIKNRTWKEVPNDKICEISVKWIFKVKRTAEGNIDRYKARVFARCFLQKAGLDYDDVRQLETSVRHLCSNEFALRAILQSYCIPKW